MTNKLETSVTNNFENKFDKDLTEVLLAVDALPRNVGKRDYVQKLFDKAFPKIHKQIVNKEKTKHEIVENIKGTAMAMSYSSFLGKYNEAKNALKAKKRKNPKEFAKASRDFN